MPKWAVLCLLLRLRRASFAGCFNTTENHSHLFYSSASPIRQPILTNAAGERLASSIRVASTRKVMALMLAAIAVQMLVDGLVSIFCNPESVFFLNQSLFHRRNRKVTINIDPSKKIVSSFLLESKGS